MQITGYELDGKIVPLEEQNLEDIMCCPGGLEVRNGDFLGDISKTLSWEKEMFDKGMEGFIVYKDGISKGFLEYMPAESAPYPIEAPGSAIIMCFHWATVDEVDDSGHHKNEEELLKILIDQTKDEFSGLSVLAWDNPVHFPIDLFERLGFDEVKKNGYISLMYLSFEEDGENPSLLAPKFEPRDYSDKNKVAIDVGYSNRCPYSIHNKSKVEKAVGEMNAGKIDLKTYGIDTREEAIKYSISPWNWDWSFVNGESMAHHEMEIKEIKKVLKERLTRL